MFDCTSGSAVSNYVCTDSWDYPYGHATPIAGIIGAVNNGNYVEGICPNAKLGSFKVDMTSTQGDFAEVVISDIVAAFNKISSNSLRTLFKVINVSLGFYDYSQILYNAMSNYPGLIVCAAGNENINIDNTPMYPAAFNLSNIITVGAIDYDNDIWSESATSGSNYGSSNVDVFAPGNQLYMITSSGGYMTSGGTSFAAPFVSGLAGLLFALNPNLTAAQVKNAIMNSAVSNANLNGKCVTGGVINAYSAVTAVHTHTLNIYNYYNSTYHTKECSCGYSTLEAHEFVLALNAGEYAIKPSRRCIYCGYTTI